MSSIPTIKRVCCARPGSLVHRGDCVRVFGLNVLLQPHGAREPVFLPGFVAIHECRCGRNLPPITHILDDVSGDEEN